MLMMVWGKPDVHSVREARVEGRDRVMRSCDVELSVCCREAVRDDRQLKLGGGSSMFLAAIRRF